MDIKWNGLEVPLERSILADFAAYHVNNYKGKLNGFMKENMHRYTRNENDQSCRQRVKHVYCLACSCCLVRLPFLYNDWFPFPPF